jgi:hypothetical protein
MHQEAAIEVLLDESTPPPEERFWYASRQRELREIRERLEDIMQKVDRD